MEKENNITKVTVSEDEEINKGEMRAGGNERGPAENQEENKVEFPSGYDLKSDPVRHPVSGRWKWETPTEEDIEQYEKWRRGKE